MKANAPLKLMYLNPVGTEAYDAVFADMARTYKLPGTEVHIACLADAGGSFTHIEYRSYETIVSRGIIQATRQAAREGFDALAIGCFYDTALHDAREISGEMVVTAPCLASCEIAASLANRFGIIVGRRKWVNQMNAVAREHGYGERLSGFYHVELGVNDFQADHAETERRLVEAGRKAVEEDYAEALILGCTLEIGFYREIEKAVGVPVIDPSIAAMKRAEYAANLKRQCGWVPSRMWSCEPPPEEEIARFGGFDEGDAFASAWSSRRSDGAQPSPVCLALPLCHGIEIGLGRAAVGAAPVAPADPRRLCRAVCRAAPRPWRGRRRSRTSGTDSASWKPSPGHGCGRERAAGPP